jgi:predicted metal-dependent enzyme (double-stranded beta helix superfamily)
MILDEIFGLDIYIHRLREAFEMEEKPGLQTESVSLLVAEILKERKALTLMLERLAHDIHFAREQAANMFDNEIILWRDPNRTFSIRSHLWAPDEPSFIHDHNAWGILSAWSGFLIVENYERLDSGRKEGTARLRLKEKIILEEGMSILVRPLNEGIHRVMSGADQVAVSLSIYGRPGGRKYILKFDPETSTTERIYPPSRKHQTLARNVLGKVAGG